MTGISVGLKLWHNLTGWCPNNEHLVNSMKGLKCREQRHAGGDVQTGREELDELERKTREMNKWLQPQNNDSEEQRNHRQTVASKDSISKRKMSIRSQKQPKEELMRIQEIHEPTSDWANQWPTTEALSKPR
jgi:hypothetical protein